MKKFKLTGAVLVLATLASAACLVAGCGEEEAHTHTYSESWAFDSAAHWHPASCGHDAKKEKGAHSFVERVFPATDTATGYTVYTCACGYTYTDNVTDSQNPPEKSAWQFNANMHWNTVAAGGAISGYAAHDYETSVISPTCSVAGYTLHACKVCNYWYRDHIVSPTGVHTYNDSVWECDEEFHWHSATCCDVGVSPKTSHDFAVTIINSVCNETTHTDTYRYTCKACGYNYTDEPLTLDGHSYEESWTSDEYFHWREASCEHDVPAKDKGEHVFEEGGTVCTVCEKAAAARLAYKLNAEGTEYTVTGILGDLTEIVIPETERDIPVTKIERGAFAGTDITSLTLPARFTKIPNRLCEGCTNLTSVTLQGEVTEIGDLAFKGCSALNVTIPSSVTKIGLSAFNGCPELTSALPTTLASIGEYAFKDCIALTEITIPATVTVMEGKAFKGCTGLETLTVNSGFVGDYAFENCTKLSSVTLNGVVSIGEGAFGYCKQLTALTFPATLEHVGAQAFGGSGLITTENGVVYAANVATGFELTVREISLKSGTIGIADEAFKGFSALLSVTLNEDVRFIGVNAFRKCTNLIGVAFPANVKTIGANAFRESGLRTVNIPATVTDVGDNAFYDCAGLSSVEVHAANIGKFAFSYTGTGRTMDSIVKERPDIAHLTSVTLGAEVRSIGSNAFQYCPITAIEIPEGVEKIGQYAFAQTDLTQVTIPASVTKIGEHAFYGCALTAVTFTNATGWKAGDNAVTIPSAAEAVTLLQTTYAYEDWVRTDAGESV